MTTPSPSASFRFGKIGGVMVVPVRRIASFQPSYNVGCGSFRPLIVGRMIANEQHDRRLESLYERRGSSATFPRAALVGHLNLT
jgi:hypothetical protein